MRAFVVFSNGKNGTIGRQIPFKVLPDYLSRLQSSLSRIPAGAHVWLGGDFNLGDIDWSNECVRPYANDSIYLSSDTESINF